MKRLTTTICLTLAVLLGSTGVSFALPECNGSPVVGSKSDSAEWDNCEGTHIFAKSGNKYVGELRNGKKHGQGTYTYADGDKYVGEFRNDKYNGQGTVTYADGRIKEGIWKDGKFQYAQQVTPPAKERESSYCLNLRRRSHEERLDTKLHHNSHEYKAEQAYHRRDYAEAVCWWKALARSEWTDRSGRPYKETVTSWNNLGYLYTAGIGVPKDHKVAMKWYRLAAKAGSVDAQANMGASYEAGNGVPKDLIIAKKWYRLAASKGHKIAIRQLKLPKFQDIVVTASAASEKQLVTNIAKAYFSKNYLDMCHGSNIISKYQITNIEKRLNHIFDLMFISLQRSSGTFSKTLDEYKDRAWERSLKAIDQDRVITMAKMVGFGTPGLSMDGKIQMQLACNKIINLLNMLINTTEMAAKKEGIGGKVKKRKRNF